MKDSWRGSGVKCYVGVKTCPALAGLSQREKKVLLWESVHKQGGRGEEGPCSLLATQQRMWVKGQCRRETRCPSPALLLRPIGLLANSVNYLKNNWEI